MSFIPECKVCFTKYNKGKHCPVISSCGHGICITCVEQIKKNTYASSFIPNKMYKCPICNQHSEDYYKNYDLLEIIENSEKEMLKPKNIIVETLESTIKKMTNEIKVLSEKYIALEEKKNRLSDEIIPLENKHHYLFDKYFKEVKEMAEKKRNEIISNAERNAIVIEDIAKEQYDKIMRDANEKVKNTLENSTYEIKIKIKEQENKLENAVKKFNDEMSMENMIRQHKRNFVTNYDSMVNTLQKIKTLLKNVQISSSTSAYQKSAKKDIHKLITDVQNWNIESFIYKIN